MMSTPPLLEFRQVLVAVGRIRFESDFELVLQLVLERHADLPVDTVDC